MFISQEEMFFMLSCVSLFVWGTKLNQLVAQKGIRPVQGMNLLSWLVQLHTSLWRSVKCYQAEVERAMSTYLIHNQFDFLVLPEEYGQTEADYGPN